MRNRKTMTYSLVLSALLIALGMVLPLFLGQVTILEQGISPMHIPAFLAGLTVGPVWGGIVGVVMPLLRMVIFGMPPLAVAVPMAFELAAYAVISGILYQILRGRMKKLAAIVIAMLVAMIAGRLVGGGIKAIWSGMNGTEYGMQAFIAAYFVGTAVGAVIHLIVCPAVTLALEGAGLSPMGSRSV